jgi:hypothetical protein
MSNTSTVLAYNKNDFSWSSNIDINDNFCKVLQQKDCDTSDDTCNNNKKLCDNYYLYNELKKIQTQHSGSNERYSDINSQYNNEISNTVKFSIGIAGMLYLYWKLR